MNHKDPHIDQLYQKGDKTQPPKAIDDAILAHAEQAHQSTRLGRLRPWLAAASVLFALPILWLMLEQPELQQVRQESLQPEPIPSAPVSNHSSKPDIKAKPAPSAEDRNAQDKLTEQGKITVTGSRIKRQDPELDMAGLEAPVTAEKKRAATKEANQEFSELKAEQEPLAEDSLQSAPAILPVNNPMQQIPKSISDLIERLKPEKLTETEQSLWQNLQQQIAHQQWQQSQKTLQQLKETHPEINFDPLQLKLKQLSSD